MIKMPPANKCETCNRAFRGKKEIPEEEKEVEEEKLECILCERLYKNEKSLARHMKQCIANERRIFSNYGLKHPILENDDTVEKKVAVKE